MAPASSKKRGVKPSLTREQIMSKAFEIADEIGPEKTSLRTVADALYITPMGLYTYVSSKEDLINGIYDLFLKEIPTTPIPGEFWEDTFRRMCQSNLMVALKHPRIANSLIEERSWGPARHAYAKRVTAIYLEQGVDPSLLGQSWVLYDGLLNTFIKNLLNSCAFDDGEQQAKTPLDAYIDRVSTAYNDYSIEDHWEVVIAGIRALAGPEQASWRTPE